MQTKSLCTTGCQLAASKILPHEKLLNTDTKSFGHLHQNLPSVNAIRAASLNESLIPALSLDDWLIFELRNLA